MRVKDGNAAAGRGAPTVSTSPVRAGGAVRRARVTTAHGSDTRREAKRVDTREYAKRRGVGFQPARG